MKGRDEERRWYPRVERQLFVVVIDERLTAVYGHKDVPRPREKPGGKLPGRHAITCVGHVARIRFASISLMLGRDLEENIVIPRFGAGHSNRSD